MNILILGIGGPTPRSIAGRIREKFPNARIVGTDINPKALGFFIPNLVDKYYLIPRASHQDYFNRLNQIIKDEDIDMAFVQPEQEVRAWGKYFNDHGSYPCPVLIPPVEHVDVLMDKAEMASLLSETDFIPETVRITPSNPKYEQIEKVIGYPCWIRASIGSGGLGSLKLSGKKELEAWLFIHKDIPEFTVNKFLTGRHLANQMLYIDGECVRNAGLHCVEYVMADIAPSKITGNTSYGLLINDKSLLDRCELIMRYVQDKTGVKANGVYSFDLKEDDFGNQFVTEINIRHMAYTGIMARCGFDLISDTISLLNNKFEKPETVQYQYDKPYAFLRDVDVNPIIIDEPK